jgi:hypothetical protein
MTDRLFYGGVRYLMAESSTTRETNGIGEGGVFAKRSQRPERQWMGWVLEGVFAMRSQRLERQGMGWVLEGVFAMRSQRLERQGMGAGGWKGRKGSAPLQNRWWCKWCTGGRNVVLVTLSSCLYEYILCSFAPAQFKVQKFKDSLIRVMRHESVVESFEPCGGTSVPACPVVR